MGGFHQLVDPLEMPVLLGRQLELLDQLRHRFVVIRALAVLAVTTAMFAVRLRPGPVQVPRQE